MGSDDGDDHIEDFDDSDEVFRKEVSCTSCCDLLLNIVILLGEIFEMIIRIGNKLCAIVLTIFDLFGLIYVLSFILHFIILIGTRLVENEKERNTYLVMMVCVGLSLVNILFIPMYVFSKLSYFTYSPFFVHKVLLAGILPCIDLKEVVTYKILGDGKRIVYDVFNFIYTVILIIYLAFFFLSITNFDNMTFFLMIIIPSSKYISALFLYGLNGWLAMFNICGHESMDLIKRDPILLSMYSAHGIRGLFSGHDAFKIVSVLWFFIKFICSLGILIFIMNDESKLDQIPGYKATIIIFYILTGIPLIVSINFSIFWLSDKCNCCGIESDDDKKSNAKEEANKYRFIIVYVLTFLSYLILILLFWVIIKNVKKHSYVERKYDIINLDSTYEYTGQPPDPTENNMKEIVSQVCYVKPYGLKMLHYAAIAYSAYYDMNIYNEEMNESDSHDHEFISNEAKFLNEFFGNPKYNFTSVKSMKLEPNKIGSANIFQFDQFNLTVIGIRGSTESLDWALNIQTFMSSALLTASSLGVLTTSTLPFTAKAIRMILAFPLELLSNKKLLDKFKESIDNFIAENEGQFRNNVIFVGHSLGGALAKLYGHIHGYASISISGPGVSLFQTIYPSPKRDLNMVITQAEIVPDRDVVPRVEISAGTKYRVLCNQDLKKCHNIDHTLCMLGVMCQTPHDSYCSHLDSTKSIYDDMKKLSAEYEIE